MIEPLDFDATRLSKRELEGNRQRSAGPWLVFKRDENSLLIMGQDGAVVAEFYDCMGRGKANRDFALKAVAAMISQQDMVVNKRREPDDG
jgi:hypothetical protein